MRILAVSWLYGCTLFASALLLFLIQPMIGKMVLPALGGTPAVWNTCLLFFQCALLAGYLQAHLVAEWASPSLQRVVQGFLFVLALGSLPMTAVAERAAAIAGGPTPAPRLLSALIVTAGLPLLALAATAPLLQRWYSMSGQPGSSDPYYLYAASNAGSLLAVVSYPWMIEPWLTLGEQVRVWSISFGVLAALVMACSGWITPGTRRRSPSSAQSSVELADRSELLPKTAFDRAQGFEWVVLSFVPVGWLAAVTAYVTTDLAAVPLLWMIPLALYLVSFILAFSPATSRLALASASLLPWAVVPLVLVLSAGLVQVGWIPLHWLAFFLGALGCHGRLAAGRPAVRDATRFYLAIALGGALGGAFNALVAPSWFDGPVEYPMMIVLGCLIAPQGLGPLAEGWSRAFGDLVVAAIVAGLTGLLVLNFGGLAESVLGVLAIVIASGLGVYAGVTGLRRPIRFALTAAGVLLASGLAQEPGGRLIHRERNFFGTLKVLFDSELNVHRLFHGSTLHGEQSLDPARRSEPTTYFARSGPMGDVFRTLEDVQIPSARGDRLAIVGLGAGTLACYARPGESWDFFEIDPAVIRIAQDGRFFHYLSDCRERGVKVNILAGDARTRLRDAPDRAYRLIVLDAFSSDALPLHLISHEAIQLYRRKLAPGGLLAFNLSNRYLDLEPVIGRQAYAVAMECRLRYDLWVTEIEKRAGKQPSIWAVMAESEQELGSLADHPLWQGPRLRVGARVWTDDYADLASYLVLRPQVTSARRK